MSFVMAAAAPVAASAVRAPAKSTSKGARAASTAPVSRANGAGAGTASFFNGGASSSAALRTRGVNAPVAARASRGSVVRASAMPAPVVQAADAAPAAWKGAKLKPLGFSVLAGLIIWLIPAPIGVTAKAWHLLAVFVGTIVGIITNVRRGKRGIANPRKCTAFCKLVSHFVLVFLPLPFHPTQRDPRPPTRFDAILPPLGVRVLVDACYTHRARYQSCMLDAVAREYGGSHPTHQSEKGTLHCLGNRDTLGAKRCYL